MRVLLTALAAAVCVPTMAQAQAQPPRSGDSLWAATVDDARSTWVNPAGLGLVTEASIMGELVLDWSATDAARVGQWMLGLNARGLSIAYQRDRFPDDAATAPDESRATSTLRFATAVPISRGAVGGSVSLYRGGTAGSEFGFEVGATYFVTPRTPVAAVLRNIGRPVTLATRTPLTGVLGGGWIVMPRVLEVGAEAHVSERLSTSGYDTRFRTGLAFSPGTRVPVTLRTAADFSSSGLDQWVVGVAVGGTTRGVLLGSGGYGGGAIDFQRLSLTGIASHGPDRLSP